MVAEIILAGLFGYLVGAIPAGIIVCRLIRGVDVRKVGSGHTGGLNVSRAAGIWAGVATGVVDTLLGVAAVAGATCATHNTWAATAAGVMAIIGHNWSVYIRFGGGIGISTTAGSLLYLFPLATIETLAVILLGWLILIKLFRFHHERSRIFVVIFIGPLLYLLGIPLNGIVLGTLGSLVMIIKTIPDWNRKND